MSCASSRSDSVNPQVHEAALGRSNTRARTDTTVSDGLRNLAVRMRASETAPLDGGAWLVIVRLESWVRRYVRRVHNASDTLDVADDALQHLLLAIFETRERNIIDSDYLIPWCKRVIRNFVVSEQRRRSQFYAKLTEQSPSTYSIEHSVEVRSAMARLIHILRREISGSDLPERDDARLRSFDSWIARVLSGGAQSSRDRRVRNRTEQRCSRVRRLAVQAFEQLRQDGRISEDLLQIAASLGLEDPRMSSVQSTSNVSANVECTR